MVRGRLAGGIGAARIVRRVRVERRIRICQRAEHLVGRDMMKAEFRALLALERGKICPCGFQQHERAGDIGVHKIRRPVDRAVDMAFRRQMHHRIRLMRGKRRAHRRRIGNIRLHQKMARMAQRTLQRVLGGRIGHLVDIDDFMVAACNGAPDHGRADKAAAAGKKNFHASIKSSKNIVLLPNYRQAC